MRNYYWWKAKRSCAAFLRSDAFVALCCLLGFSFVLVFCLVVRFMQDRRDERFSREFAAVFSEGRKLKAASTLALDVSGDFEKLREGQISQPWPKKYLVIANPADTSAITPAAVTPDGVTAQSVTELGTLVFLEYGVNKHPEFYYENGLGAYRRYCDVTIIHWKARRVVKRFRIYGSSPPEVYVIQDGHVLGEGNEGALPSNKVIWSILNELGFEG